MTERGIGMRFFSIKRTMVTLGAVAALAVGTGIVPSMTGHASTAQAAELGQHGGGHGGGGHGGGGNMGGGQNGGGHNGGGNMGGGHNGGGHSSFSGHNFHSSYGFSHSYWGWGF